MVTNYSLLSSLQPALTAALLLAPALLAAAPPGGTVLPAGTSLPKQAMKGPWSSGRGALQIPDPEQGTVERRFYRNAYFGVQLPLPPGWRQKPGGPPPTDSGYYVLAQLVPNGKASEDSAVLIAAQDMFFAQAPADSPAAFLRHVQTQLPARYTVDQAPADVQIGTHSFSRLAYSAHRQHWLVLTTQIRCHILQLVFSGPDATQLRALSMQLGRLTALPTQAAPVCAAGFVTAEHLVSKVEPLVPAHRNNRIPVRLIIDPQGRVTHIHLLSAYAEQFRALADAVMQWRFTPYTMQGQAVAVESGVMFGAATRPDSQTP